MPRRGRAERHRSLSRTVPTLCRLLPMACRALPAFPLFLSENSALGNGDIAILAFPTMVFLPLLRAEVRRMPADSLEKMIRGAVPLERKIFRDPNKRRLIPQLVEDGWPIIEVAGKYSAFPTDIDRHI